MTFPLRLKQHQIADVTVPLYEPDSTFVIEAYQQRLIKFPYWSQVWPAAVALACFMVKHPHYTLGKHVLELAAGLGLPSVIAASSAAFVIASDYEPEAVNAMQQTVAYNHLQNMQVQLLDWYALPADLATDVLLLSDVSYDAALFEVQQKRIKQLLQQGTVVIISSPQRLVAKEALQPLLPFCNYLEEIQVQHNHAAVTVTVMVLQL